MVCAFLMLAEWQREQRQHLVDSIFGPDGPDVDDEDEEDDQDTQTEDVSRRPDKGAGVHCALLGCQLATRQCCSSSCSCI